MCNSHEHLTTNKAKSARRRIRPLLLDPTGTTPLQRSFLVAIFKHLDALKKDITDLLVNQDALQLSPVAPKIDAPVINFDFTTDPTKIAAFRLWLKERVDAGILLVDPAFKDRPWLSSFIFSAYKKAEVDAYAKIYASRSGGTAADIRSKEKALQTAFNTGTRSDAIERLYTRTYENLKGITADMSAKISTILSDGLAHGKNPKVIAKEIAKSVDGITKTRATTLARTEIINTYTEATLDSYEELGVPKVSLFAEWITAGDDRVCPKCAAMNAAVLTLKEARGLIPFHPNCRCAWLPLIDENSGKKSRAASRKRRLEKAKNKARKAGAKFPEDG